MATSVDAKRIITLRESCSMNTRVEPATDVQNNKMNRWWRNWKFRSIGSSNLLLILTWQFIIECSVCFTVQQFVYMTMGEDEDSYFLLWMKQWKVQIGVVLLSCVSLLVISFLPGIFIGRYKLVSFTLRAMWLISVVGSVIYICKESFPTGNAIYYILLFLVVIPQYWLMGVYITTAVPLAMDQITGGSSTISAFIQWLVWTYFSCISVTTILGTVFFQCSKLQTHVAITTMSLLPVLLLSVGLILDFCFHHKLVKEPVTVNPVSLIFKVLKYAAKHKYPVQRSAFTYCDNERPTRLDYGKSKYGGPFTTEQVEDVKTIWRIVAVIMTISLFTLLVIPQFETASTIETFGQHETNCSIPVVLHCISTPSSIIMYSIPLYELMVYPCLRNQGPSILQSAGIGAAGVIVSSIYGMIAESVQQIPTNATDTCTKGLIESKQELTIGIPFNCILAITAFVPVKSSVEFVCAQAPYNMNGLLIGVLLTLEAVYATIGTLFHFAWSERWFGTLSTSTCGIWFYLTTLVLAVVSSALLGLVIRWYKARERDETTRSQNLVEEIYHKYRHQANQTDSQETCSY